MKLKRKIACIVTAAACLLNTFIAVNISLIAEAEGYSDIMIYGDYLYYQQVDEDDDGTYDYIEISDCGKSAVAAEIPSEIDGLPVEKIGTCAFESCISLKSITIPDSVTSIGEKAFRYCRFESIEIPDSVKTIGYGAFSGTVLLANQTGVKYVDRWVVDCDNDVISAEVKDGTRGIADKAFFGCESLASIKIPNSVKSIGNEAFESVKEDFIIFGHTDSAAQAYAKKHVIKFECPKVEFNKYESQLAYDDKITLCFIPNETGTYHFRSECPKYHWIKIGNISSTSSSCINYKTFECTAGKNIS